jgi:proteasome lid subunit RPN8/RPN11
MDAIKNHALSAYPRECCGLIVRTANGDSYRGCTNTAEHGDDFRIDPVEYARIADEGDITHVVHSHPDSPAVPSTKDWKVLHYSGHDWMIISCTQDAILDVQVHRYIPPLKGREFVHREWDCFTYIRDYYEVKYNIHIPEFKYEDDWWEHGKDLYRDNVLKCGFVPVIDFKEGDLLLMRVRCDVDNHAAIYIGDSRIAHHVIHRLSGTILYNSVWQRLTFGHFRHGSLL